MSQKAARALIEKMKTDTAFRAKVMAVEDVGARMRLIKTEGFECSSQEIGEVQSELADDELDAVSGGGFCLSDCGRL